MLRKIVLYCVVGLVMNACAFSAQAKFIDMTSCYFSDDVFYDGRTQYVIRNTPEVFYNACYQECLKFTKLRSCGKCPGKPDCSASGSSIGLSDYDMNIDIILDCQAKCRSGIIYSGDFRLSAKSPPVINGSDFNMCNITDLSTNISYFADQPQFKATETDFTVSAGENIIITLNQPPVGMANEIVQCGHTAKIIEPENRSLTASEWQSYPKNKDKWHARNYVPYDTQIDVMDGDELTITYQGQYRSRISAYDYKYDNSLYIRKAINSNTTNWTPAGIGDVHVIDASKFVPATNGGDLPDAMGPVDVGLGLQGSSTGILQNRYFNAGTTGIAYDISNSSTTRVTKYERSVLLQGTISGFSSQFARLGIVHPDIISGYNTVLWDGNFLEGWNDNLGGFRVTIERKGCVKKNGRGLQYGVGAYRATCAEPPDPNDIHCVVGTYKIPVTWADVPDISNFKPVTVQAPSQGKLFFRIAPLNRTDEIQKRSPQCVSCGSQDEECKTAQAICKDTIVNITTKYFPAIKNHEQFPNGDSMIAGGASDGQYFITLKRQVKNNVTAFISEVISTPIRLMHYYLFGDLGQKTTQIGSVSGMDVTVTGYCSVDALNYVAPYRLDCGVVPKIYNAFISGYGYIDAIRAALVLYLAISALTFLGGFAPMTEREFVNRILKISVIVTLISPGSWEFFNTRVFQIFVEGALQIMVYIANISQSGGVVNMTVDQARTNFGDIFGFFDLTFSVIMSKVIWFKIIAILFSSFYGIFMFFAIFNSFFRVLKSLLKAAVLYAMNLLGIAILLMLAPLFISFMLFKTTFSMFDAWVKQLLSFAMQPIVVIICLFMLNNLLLFVLHKVFEFTICTVCILGIYIPFVNISVCFLNGYVALSSMFSLSIFVLPIKLFATAFFLSIIASAMEHFIEFGAQLTGNIINQGSTPDLAARGNAKSMLTEQAQGIIPLIFGGSLAGRRGDSLKSKFLQTAVGGVIGRRTLADIREGRDVTKSVANKLSSFTKSKKDSDGGDKGGGNDSKR